MTTPDPNPNPVVVSAPTVRVPDGACDCHCHVFGPYDTFPLAADASYVPPESPVAAYLRMLDTLHLSRGVLVQGSAHGLDNRAMLAAIAAAPDRLRGVAVADHRAGLEDLAELAARGVRGLRFNRLAHGGGRLYRNAIDLSMLPDMVPMLREVGLHVQLWMDLDQLPGLAPLIRSAGVPFVVDHMGRPDPQQGVDQRDFALLCRLLEEGHLWVKLTPYRLSSRFPDYADLRPFHDRLVAANPERVVWACDWPHVNMAPAVMPDAGHLLDLLVRWTGSDDLLDRILVTNPARLYGF